MRRAQHRLWLVGGTLPLASGEAGRVHEREPASFRPQGECVARYDKIHLFRYDNGRERYDEGRTLEAGSSAGGVRGRRAGASA